MWLRICSLQKSKGYFFAISFVIIIVVLFFSWQLFRQSSYQPIRELNRIGMTEQFSKIESLNKPLDSIENLASMARLMVPAPRTNMTLAQVPLSKVRQELSQKEFQVQMFDQRNKILYSQRKFLNRNPNSNLTANRGKIPLDNTNKSSMDRTDPSKSNPMIPLQTNKQKTNSKNTGTHPKPNKLLNSVEKLNLRTNSIKAGSITQPKQINVARSQLSTRFVDDIHNFHVPDRQKILAGRNHLEDALSKAAMDPQDHLLTGKLCQNCQALGFRYDLNVEDICQGNVHLLIIVESPPNNRMARDAIRKTWGLVSQDATSEIRVVFLLGKSSLDPENKLAKVEHWHNQDVVQIDFMDAYANLTYKTLSGLHWVHTFCPNAKYVMKTDDDMYVNTPLIVKMLRATPKTKFLGGYCWGISTPHRDSRSKWYVPYEMYSASTFPPMCSGTGYIMSRDLVDQIINVSMNIKFFYLEDVYIALCLEKFQISPVNIQGFSNMLVNFDGCQFRNYVLTSHGHSPYELREAWPIIQTCPQQELTPHQLFMPIPYPDVD